jgi:hypothetical protein
VLRSILRALYIAVFLALAVGYYGFLGAGPTPSERPEDIAWWRPAGWARQLDWEPLAPLQQIGADVEQARHEGRTEPRGLIPLALFALPPLLLGAAGFALFRAVGARVAVLALTLLLCAFSYYGWLDPETWKDYSWRWPAVLLVSSLYVSVFALAPALVRAFACRSAAAQAAAILVFVVSIYFLSIEISGTNPELDWNISPWPALTLFGFLLFGLVIGSLHLAAGVGVAVGARWTGAAGVAAAAGVAGLLAALLYWLPFSRWSPGRMAALLLAAAALAAWTARRAAGATAARPLLAAGILVLGAIQIGRWQGEWFLARSRDEIAPRVVAAVERYRAERGGYPDELRQVVPQYLPAIPLPRVGWFDDPDEAFNYINLGDSFLLEFPSVLWVQCAYSPAYREEGEEEETPGIGAGEAAAPGVIAEAGPSPGVAAGEAEGGEALEAAWSCESKPPRLW